MNFARYIYTIQLTPPLEDHHGCIERHETVRTIAVTLQSNQMSYTTWRRSSNLMGSPSACNEDPPTPPRQSSPPPPTRDSQPEEPQKTLRTLPSYVRGFSEKLERILAPWPSAPFCLSMHPEANLDESEVMSPRRQEERGCVPDPLTTAIACTQGNQREL